MKTKISFLAAFLFFTLTAFAQKKEISHPDPSEMYSMTESVIKYHNGAKYYLRGAEKPYTGFLYARYDNGELEAVSQVVNGVGNGIWINYAPDGSKECQGTYVDDRVEGPVTFFYEDGSVKSEGQYRDWKKPIGKWTYYDRAGNVVSTRVFTP